MSCTHPHSVDVTALTGEIVARYCPDCEHTYYPVDDEDQAQVSVWTQQAGWRHYG